MSLYNELPIVFPWYEKQELQDRYRENVDGICTFKLITPQNSLLPFQFFKTKELTTIPVKWEVFEAQSMNKVADLTTSIPQIRYSAVSGFDYFTWEGNGISGIRFPAGYYFSIITFAGGAQYFSEVFFVPEHNAFNVEDDDDIKFLRLAFYNNGDIQPIFYNEEAPDGSAYFTQVVYLDSFITSSEPEIEEDGTKDGNDILIPTFQKLTIKYRISLLVTDFLKKALCTLPMHSFVGLTTEYGLRYGEINQTTVDSSLEANGALSSVDILFTEILVLVKKGCDGDMAKDCVGDDTQLEVDPGTTGNYLLSGYAALDTTVQFYGADSLDGVRHILAGITCTAAQLNAGVNLPIASFAGYNFIAAKAFSTGCDFGFSLTVPKP